MKRNVLVYAARFAVVVGLGLPACSSSSSSAGATKDAGSRDQNAADVYVVSPNNCVKPGATGNEKGVGAYCIPGTGDCPTVDGGQLLFCSGDFQTSHPDDIFCTTPCTTTADCGSGAFCVTTSLGTGCAPAQCIPPDAGETVVDASVTPAMDAAATDGAGEQ